MTTITDLSVFFKKDTRLMFDIDWNFVLTIPEFKKLENTKQHSYWHKEGNAFIHTMMTCNAMRNIISFYGFSESDGQILMISALFHDIGKGVATELGEDGEYHSKLHAYYSEKMTRTILWDLNDINKREEICALVGQHMKPLYLGERKNPTRAVIEFSMRCSVEKLLALKKADCMGAINDDTTWSFKLNNVKDIALNLNCYYSKYKFLNDKHKFVYFNKDGKEMPNDAMHNTSYDFQVFIMCGLPGSGKDTYIKNVLLPKYDCDVICRDDIRTEMGLKGDKPMGNKAQEEEVTRIVNERFDQCCKAKKSFIINATNLKKQYRSDFIKKLAKYNAQVTIVYIEAPTINDNLMRRDGQIDKSVILNMRDRFDFPDEMECHNLIIVKQ